MFSTVSYTPAFIESAGRLFNELWGDLEWERRGSTPRREYFCSDSGEPYSYGVGAGVRSYEAREWAPVIKTVRSAVEAALDTKFDVCFLNGYEDGRDHLGWHADDSPEMDDERPIAIVSLGAEREIWFRANSDPTDVRKLLLTSGSLCVMAPGMQDTHKHRIPKASFECGPRVSLTFRGFVHR